MKTSLGPRIRIAIASLLFGAIAVTAWSCACSTASHGTMQASGSTSSSTTDDSMGLGSNVGSEVGSAAASGSGSASSSGSASGSGSDGTAVHTTDPGRGEQCAPNNACGPGLQCVKYYGVAGPRGPQLDSCETPCKDDPKICPSGTKCVKIADGPGDVCR